MDTNNNAVTAPFVLASSARLEMREYKEPKVDNDIRRALDAGFAKHTVVLYKPFGGNNILLYDENIRPIVDAKAVFDAKKIIITNQPRVPGEPLRGLVRFEGNAHVCCDSTPKHKVVVDGYSICDEFSLFAWEPTISCIEGDMMLFQL